ncbi:GIY-YIG nuclease family protein [Candidatus Woesearchaeota archaeon]|nr:GIY-YIG nuclease family protein [Candidatus Woesearchaeota archaeon]
MSTGIYALIIKLNSDKNIKIGKKGINFFPKGYYVYVGSALNNLEKRIARHKSKHKKLRWHIDYFQQYAEIIDVKTIQTNKKLECWLSKKIEKISDKLIMKGFGSSDCRCRTHLYYFEKNPSIELELLLNNG